MANSAPRLISGICMQIASGFLAKMFNEERTEDKKEKKNKNRKKTCVAKYFPANKTKQNWNGPNKKSSNANE